jgi:hypothetical protein
MTTKLAMILITAITTILGVILLLAQSNVGIALFITSSVLLGLLCLSRFLTPIPMIPTIVSGVAALVILLFCCILPYSMQVSDACDIDRLNDDIALYQKYVDKYQNEDKVILEEWAKQQAELSKKLSAIGIQFAGSIEPNNIIKKLSDKIASLLNSITDKELEINKVKSGMKARVLNRWFFGM